MNILEETFKAVSNPKHERYGKFLTKQEVFDMVKPSNGTNFWNYKQLILENSDAFATVGQWLSEYKKDIRKKINHDSIEVSFRTSSNLITSSRFLLQSTLQVKCLAQTSTSSKMKRLKSKPSSNFSNFSHSI